MVNKSDELEPAPQPAKPEPAPQPAKPEPAPQPAKPEPAPQPAKVHLLGQDSNSSSGDAEKKKIEDLEQERLRVMFTLYSDRLQALSKEMQNFQATLNKNKKDSKSELDTLRTDFESRITTAERRSVEIIGIISSIIALFLAFTSVSLRQIDVAAGYIILLTGAASIAMFAILIHFFFNDEAKKSGQIFKWLLLPLLTLVVTGILAFVYPSRLENTERGDQLNITADVQMNGESKNTTDFKADIKSSSEINANSQQNIFVPDAAQ